MSDYAERLREQITDENPNILGLSFGGMIAIEISKQIKTKKIILLSSAKNKSELPFSYRLAGLLKLNYLIPSFLFTKSNFFINWLFGAKTKEVKNLLRIVLKETDKEFVKWSINALLNWQNNFSPENSIRIHGTNDHLIPLKSDDSINFVKGGSHLMVLNEAAEISLILKEKLT